MTEQDPVIESLRSLPQVQPLASLSRTIQIAAHAKLRVQRVHPVWTFAVAASVVSYLSWALVFTSNLY